MKSAASLIAVSAALVMMTSSGANARVADAPGVSGSAVLGPAGDYPMVLGDPFVVEGVTFTPADTLNYDSVGYAQASTTGEGVSGEHRTLPLPSYVEVTSLESGRTVLVRLTRRGPMTGSDLITLSPAAWEQLGLAPGARLAVRVRRVNPPEAERALLRSGARAPARMDTPPGLLGALRRKLGIAALPTAVAVAQPDALPVAAKPVVTAKAVAPSAAPAKVTPVKPSTTKASGEKPAVKAGPAIKAGAMPAPLSPTVEKTADTAPALPKPVTPKPKAVPKAVKTEVPKPTAEAEVPKKAEAARPAARSFVQVGAYSAKDRAEKVAKAVGGSVSSAGKLWRVRIGPNMGRGEADAALAKARTAGYADAKVVTAP
ncbi:MAG: hypothetical protein RIS85_2710 [Pseudomonadota bacterium]